MSNSGGGREARGKRGAAGDILTSGRYKMPVPITIFEELYQF
jgi:hypothetical protein